MKFTVEYSHYDASRPWAVVADRSFNKVVGRYATEAYAKQRVRVLQKEYRAYATFLLSKGDPAAAYSKFLKS